MKIRNKLYNIKTVKLDLTNIFLSRSCSSVRQVGEDKHRVPEFVVGYKLKNVDNKTLKYMKVSKYKDHIPNEYIVAEIRSGEEFIINRFELSMLGLTNGIDVGDYEIQSSAKVCTRTRSHYETDDGKIISNSNNSIESIFGDNSPESIFGDEKPVTNTNEHIHEVKVKKQEVYERSIYIEYYKDIENYEHYEYMHKCIRSVTDEPCYLRSKKGANHSIYDDKPNVYVDKAIVIDNKTIYRICDEYKEHFEYTYSDVRESIKRFGEASDGCILKDVKYNITSKDNMKKVEVKANMLGLSHMYVENVLGYDRENQTDRLCTVLIIYREDDNMHIRDYLRSTNNTKNLIERTKKFIKDYNITVYSEIYISIIDIVIKNFYKL